MTTFIEDNGCVYRVDTSDEHEVKVILGQKIKTETIRINSETVADVVYQFDLKAGGYVEQSRTERHEPLPPEPSDRIAELENESAMLALELVNTQIRLEQSESEQAALLLELVNKGVL